MSEMESILLENRKMRKALDFIEKWELPKVKDNEGGLYSYGAMKGSNGERDYIRDVAREALK